MYDDVQTPSNQDPDVLRLIDNIDSDIELVTLKITPEAHAKELDCIEAVREKVRRDGGRIVFGWQLWKTNHLVEAEFHAVWETPDGEKIVDITPKSYPGVTHILFLEDENVAYEDKPIDSVRLNITNNKLVDHLIAVCQTDFRLKNRGDKATLHDDEFLKSLSEDEYKDLQFLGSLRNNISFMLENGGNLNTVCHCGSLRKYKNCHGKDLIKKLKRY